MFSGCERLTEFPQFNGLQTIGEESFSSCTGLTNLIIPEGVTAIGDYVFRENNSITEVIIPAGVKTIEQYAFYLFAIIYLRETECQEVAENPAPPERKGPPGHGN